MSAAKQMKKMKNTQLKAVAVPSNSHKNVRHGGRQQVYVEKWKVGGTGGRQRCRDTVLIFKVLLPCTFHNG